MNDTFERAVRDALSNAHRRGDIDPPGYYDNYADNNTPRIASELRAIMEQNKYEALTRDIRRANIKVKLAAWYGENLAKCRECGNLTPCPYCDS